jgi:hypothetical protein
VFGITFGQARNLYRHNELHGGPAKCKLHNDGFEEKENTGLCGKTIK